MFKTSMEIGKIICLLWFFTSCTTHEFQKIELQIETNVADDVQLFWNDAYIGNYTEENSIKLSAQQGKNHLVYELPANLSIKAIRIDLGDKKTTRNMMLKSVIIHRNNKTKDLIGDSMHQYLEGNHEVIYDSIQKAFRLTDATVEDPYIVSKNLDKLF